MSFCIAENFAVSEIFTNQLFHIIFCSSKGYKARGHVGFQIRKGQPTLWTSQELPGANLFFLLLRPRVAVPGRARRRITRRNKTNKGLRLATPGSSSVKTGLNISFDLRCPNATTTSD